jgi:predicted small integral membrane protein
MENQNSISLNNETTYGRHGDVAKNFYYGRVHQKDNLGKSFSFMVTNHLEEGKKYKFRYVCKCKAGFLNIVESHYDKTPESFISGTYGFVDNVQVWKEADEPTEHHKGLWINVLTTKGKRFNSIDKSFLLHLKVGNVHNAWKKMVDYDLWNKMESKSHADYAYKMNNVATEEVAA